MVELPLRFHPPPWVHQDSFLGVHEVWCLAQSGSQAHQTCRRGVHQSLPLLPSSVALVCSPTQLQTSGKAKIGAVSLLRGSEVYSPENEVRLAWTTESVSSGISTNWVCDIALTMFVLGWVSLSSWSKVYAARWERRAHAKGLHCQGSKSFVAGSSRRARVAVDTESWRPAI